MSVYMTEEEQLAAIKKWWQRYNTLITVVFSCVLLAASGYKYWQWHQEKVKSQASNAYEYLMVAYSDHDNKRVKSYANQLISEHNGTVYADAARLILAKLYVARENYDKATESLEYVAKNSRMKPLKEIAAIRIARLLAAQKHYDKALSELATVNDSVYLPVVNELKGDIYAAKGQYKLAIGSYRQAINEVRTQGMGNLYLEMKTNEMAALAQSAAGRLVSSTTTA
ncbi:YfgM family protein [Legionella sp. CNM-4043-24]|uniref:YfgM family protein n=1 Tax=Legionella sp. CNM-4043-24 TaxID=3421646 RepID=UPI00403AFC53